MTERLGARLSQEGDRGFFEVDFLSHKDTGELYLGELNPRVSGASSMTNVTPGAYADIPLCLFHLLEYMDVEYELDADEINSRWAKTAGVDAWSQLIIKSTEEDVGVITAAPKMGVYKLHDAGRMSSARWAIDWHNLIDESEAFYLQVAAPGDHRYEGGNLGVLVTRGRLQTNDEELTDRSRRWIAGVKGQFVGPRSGPADAAPSPAALNCGFKAA
jgi:biotin carboxylase